MTQRNNIVSAATLRFEEAAKILAAEANTIMQKSKEYGATMLSLEKKIKDLRPQKAFLISSSSTYPLSTRTTAPGLSTWYTTGRQRGRVCGSGSADAWSHSHGPMTGLLSQRNISCLSQT